MEREWSGRKMRARERDIYLRGVCQALGACRASVLTNALHEQEARGSVLFFEEPVTHWEAHNTVISNGLMASPKGHPLLKRILKSIRPVAQVFASGGSHMLQVTLL